MQCAGDRFITFSMLEPRGALSLVSGLWADMRYVSHLFYRSRAGVCAPVFARRCLRAGVCALVIRI